MWENDVNIYDVKEFRIKTNVFFGVGAISKIDEIAKNLKSQNINKIVVVSGKNAYKITGAWGHVEKALKENNIDYVNFDKSLPNPTTHQADEATKMALDFGAQAVIAIGGGSAIDVGKTVAILIKYPDIKAIDLYENGFIPNEAVPIIAINLTHGTGTEVNRFAVVTIPEKDFKPAIAYDCIYPMCSIDDPQLMTKLSKEQTIYVSIDAINHVIEAATTKIASPFSISLAKETIRLVVKYLPISIAEPENLEARYYLAYAALLGGISFDNSLLHYTHALEHPLSALKHDLSHGLGLAMLLPAVIKNIYGQKGSTLADILKPIVKGLTGHPNEALSCAKHVEDWLISVGVKSKLQDEGFTKDDVEKLTHLAFNTPSLGMLLGMAPNEATIESVKAIYAESLVPLAFEVIGACSK